MRPISEEFYVKQLYVWRLASDDKQVGQYFK